MQAGTEMPSYVLQAQKAIQKLIKERTFQRQAKQDQAEFRLAMQNFLAWRRPQDPHARSSFSYADQNGMEEAKVFDEKERVMQVISEQEEINFEDMVTDSLVQFEYDIFQQIKAQVGKKTNALFQVCRQLAKAFIATYRPLTQLEGKKMDPLQLRRETLRMKSVIQDMSIQLMRQSNNYDPIRQSNNLEPARQSDSGHSHMKSSRGSDFKNELA